MLQYGLDLLARYARKPIEELGDGGAVLEIIEERAHGHASAAKYPRPACNPRGLFDHSAIPPIQHEYTLLRKRRDRKLARNNAGQCNFSMRQTTDGAAISIND